MKKEASLAFYNEKEQIYLKADASDMDHKASPVQGMDIMWLLRNKVPDNTTF